MVLEQRRRDIGVPVQRRLEDASVFRAHVAARVRAQLPRPDAIKIRRVPQLRDEFLQARTAGARAKRPMKRAMPLPPSRGVLRRFGDESVRSDI